MAYGTGTLEGRPAREIFLLLKTKEERREKNKGKHTCLLLLLLLFMKVPVVMDGWIRVI